MFIGVIDKRVPERIKHFDSSIKLLFLVRNPIDRVMSEYLHNNRAHLNKNRTFQVTLTSTFKLAVIASELLLLPKDRHGYNKTKA